MSVKKIPYDEVAEQSVLGSMMLSSNAVEKACEKLYPESFYIEKHKIIFKALVELYNKKMPLDMTTITSELTNANKINEIGGVEFDVPIDMEYDDVTQDLYIHLDKGYQKLDGEQAEQLVRFRKNNNGTSYPYEYGDNDIGRMRTQREFL